jgi:outer membrane protein OmpA-like peptidoglycan-associated protein
VVQPDGSTLSVQYTAAKYGIIMSEAYYFNKYFGVQAEEAAHDMWVDNAGSNDGFMTMAGGLIVRTPTEHFTSFLHGLVGGSLVGGPDQERYKWGPNLTAGGGVDLNTNWFNGHLGIRLFQADYEYMHADWGPGYLSSPGDFIFGGRANINGYRVSSGVLLHIGSFAIPPQLTVACAVNPSSVFPGDPVTATATVGEADPKLNLIATISGDGISGTVSGTTAPVATSALGPGSHTVRCNDKEGKPGHEGLKPWEVATESTASFTVREYEPPTISCSANPSVIKPGDSSTISATAMSPQNRPLTYTYSASAGAINGSGTSATYSSTGAPVGPVSITCNVADDKGHTASANTGVTIEAPPVAPQPHTQALCSITFDSASNKLNPARVNNEAKACLDQVALDLQNQPDAKAVLVGDNNAKEKAEQEKMEKANARRKHAKPVENLASQRAVNTKQYLVTDKGIDPSRISVATGTTDEQKVENYLVPSGANFGADVTGTTTVDESTVKPQERKPLHERHHHKAAAKK